MGNEARSLFLVYQGRFGMHQEWPGVQPEQISCISQEPSRKLELINLEAIPQHT